MKIKLIALLCFISLSGSVASELVHENDHKIQVVATFSVLADLVAKIGMAEVEVEALVGWEQDAHVYRASPKDVSRLYQADLLVENGLGFEGWVSRLVESAKFEGIRVVASKGVDVILSRESHDGHDHEGDADPHAWLGSKEVSLYVGNILTGLKQLKPEKASYFEENASRLLKSLMRMSAEFAERLHHLPVEARNIVVPHNAFAYLGREFGIQIYSLQGLSTESEASAAQLAEVINQIKKLDIRAVFAENISDDRLIRVVQRETPAKLGGELISGALSYELAPSYLEMMQYNYDLIASALK